MIIRNIYKDKEHLIVISRNVEFMPPGKLKSLSDDYVFIYEFWEGFYE